MSRTLADMTPEERAECVGMWAQVKGSRGPFESSAESYLAIIYHAHTPDTDVHETMVLAVGYGVMTVDPRNVTPRFDLPRAWNPDRKPALMEREVGGAIHTEYRVVGKVPGLISPASMPSMAAAVDYIRRAERHLVQPGDLKIQYCTITEWEDV